MLAIKNTQNKLFCILQVYIVYMVKGKQFTDKRLMAVYLDLQSFEASQAFEHASLQSR